MYHKPSTKRSNKKKVEQLGMSRGCAATRLRKMILFSFVQKLGLDRCFQCGKRIESLAEFSVEHKVPWLDSEDPVALFFDLDNIAFSHLKCNSRATRRKWSLVHGVAGWRRGCRCAACLKAKNDEKRKYRAKCRKVGKQVH